ncbi:MAG: orotidine-5'-phosphate decarboxylase [Hyphomicrobiales bacterium]|nr:orotidine-5'-phosphate decarboxylase [Hyphomicrobiales bacterium]
MHEIRKPGDRVFVALDMQDVERAASLALRLQGHVGGVKVGKELFMAGGPAAVGRIAALGMPVFLDLKWHDIPNTVASAVRAALPLKPAFVNIHAAGGGSMIRAAAQAALEGGEDRPRLLAVTVLTSLSQEDLADTGVPGAVEDQVVRLARLAQANGADGVVCSAHEIAALRAACGGQFTLMVPGIRPAWAIPGDQKRVMTPAEAVAAGADYLVIGRPITGAENPVAAARRVEDELAAG